MRGKRPLRALFVAALALFLGVITLFSPGCTKHAPSGPTAAPAHDKGVLPPNYGPAATEEIGTIENRDEPVSHTGETEEPASPEL